MADPITMFSVMKAGSAVASGIGKFQEARQQAANDELQGFVAGTRALERDANTRNELNATLSSIRASVAASGLSITSPTSRAVMDDANTKLTRERLIGSTNDRIEAGNYKSRAKARRRSAPMSLITGAVNAGPSLITLFGD